MLTALTEGLDTFSKIVHQIKSFESLGRRFGLKGPTLSESIYLDRHLQNTIQKSKKNQKITNKRGEEFSKDSGGWVAYGGHNIKGHQQLAEFNRDT